MSVWRDLMNQRVQIQRRTTTYDVSGGKVDSYAVLASGVTCAIQPRGTHRDTASGTQVQDASHTLYFDSDLLSIVPGGLIAQDQILFTDPVTKALRTFVFLGYLEQDEFISVGFTATAREFTD